MKCEYCGNNIEHKCVVSIKAGSGGAEAQDWTQMLLRMYLFWCLHEGLEASLVSIAVGDPIGIKTAEFVVSGEGAYKSLCTEIGVHRLVRNSPIDDQMRRHTSFAAVAVWPFGVERPESSVTSQIRSYVLDKPLVKDLRTNVSTSDTQAVLDGHINQFIEAAINMGLTEPRNSLDVIEEHVTSD